MKSIELWTDGSCNPNPGPGGWAAILDDGNTHRELFGGDQDTTNNRMELMAVISGLRVLDEASRVTIFTDSQMTLNCAIGKWRRKKNRDLWHQYDDVSAKHQIQFKKVKGHHGIELNERADELANRGRLFILGKVVL